MYSIISPALDISSSKISFSCAGGMVHLWQGKSITTM
jgi:hypothetical protein